MDLLSLDNPNGIGFIVFRGEAEFEAMRAAEDWCRANGISVGTMQRGCPRGLLRGEYDIAKWRNLDTNDRADLHGYMKGDFRHGPVTVVMEKEAAEVSP